MGTVTKIEWTDHTFNPWQGCAEVSPACDNCYAREFTKLTGFKVWGKDAPRRFFTDKHWSLPSKWDRSAAEAGVRRRVFCASFADVFEARDDLSPHRARLFELIQVTPRLDWLLLTKRPENAARMLPWMLDGSAPWPNVWVGATGEDDKFAKLRARRLREVRAVVRFMSYEPALGSVDWDEVLGPGGIHWVIGGGESGGRARETELSDLRAMLAGCRRHGVTPFIKQLGRFPRSGGELVKLRDRKKGGDIEEFPSDLRVREWPEVAQRRRVEPITAPGRLDGGTYRMWLIADESQWVQWDPSEGFHMATWSPESTSVFRQLAKRTAMDFGRACRSCGYLEFEHNIDGEEKAPCGEFE